MVNIMKWQTMDSFPKDGTVVDIWHKDGGRMMDEWWDEGLTCCLPLSDFTHWMEVIPPDCIKKLADPHHLAHD